MTRARGYPQGFIDGRELQYRCTKSRENIKEYLWNLLVKQAIIWNEGALREKVFMRTQSQSQQNHLTQIEERSESQSKGREVKDPTTTQMATWARKPHNHVSKSFAMSRLDFGQGVWKGDSYRQSALIPTCDAPQFNHTLIIHANVYDQNQGLTGRYHNTTLKHK